MTIAMLDQSRYLGGGCGREREVNVLTCVHVPLNMLPCEQLISPLPSTVLCSHSVQESRNCSQGVVLFKFSIHFLRKMEVSHLYNSSCCVETYMYIYFCLGQDSNLQAHMQLLDLSLRRKVDILGHLLGAYHSKRSFSI